MRAKKEVRRKKHIGTHIVDADGKSKRNRSRYQGAPGSCRGEGAAPPPAMRTKKEAHMNPNHLEKTKGIGVVSKGRRLQNKSGWGGAGGRAEEGP